MTSCQKLEMGLISMLSPRNCSMYFCLIVCSYCNTEAF